MKDKISITIILLTLILYSCNNKSNDTGYILPPDSMVSVLKDVHLAEAVINYHQAKGNDVRNTTVQIYDSLFKRHKITKEQFDSNIVFYTQNPGEFTKIYDKVLTELNSINR